MTIRSMSEHQATIVRDLAHLAAAPPLSTHADALRPLAQFFDTLANLDDRVFTLIELDDLLDSFGHLFTAEQAADVRTETATLYTYLERLTNLAAAMADRSSNRPAGRATNAASAHAIVETMTSMADLRLSALRSYLDTAERATTDA